MALLDLAPGSFEEYAAAGGGDGLAIAFSRTLRLDEPTFDEELILPRASVLATVDA